jgi:cytochrome d ubiquinol oxidase subunit I
MRLATQQPAKLAAMELAVETEDHAPVVIGGILIDGEVRYGIELPGLGSLLARGAVDRTVTGFDQIDDADEPPANVVHASFQLMVGIGTALMLLGLGTALLRRRSRRTGGELDDSRLLLWSLVVAGPLAVVALEAGWTTTEVGRQPWIVQGVMRVRDAVTPNGGIWISFTVVALLYLGLAVVTVVVLRSMSRRWRQGEVELATPYGPPGRRSVRGPGGQTESASEQLDR